MNIPGRAIEIVSLIWLVSILLMLAVGAVSFLFRTGKHERRYAALVEQREELNQEYRELNQRFDEALKDLEAQNEQRRMRG